MKKFSKIFVLVLALCQLIGCLSACSLFKKEQEGSDSIAETVEEPFVLTKELLSSYSIVVSSQSGEDMDAVAKVLQRSIQDAYGITLEIRDDLILEGNDAFSESEYEILVGNTNRKENLNFRREDVGYALVGKKLVILGYTNAVANSSVIEFKLDILKNAPDIVLTADKNKIIENVYNYDTLLINGVDITKYKIVYPFACVNGENDIATYLQRYIADQTGYIIVTDSDASEASEYEIQIGDTSRITDDMRTERDNSGYRRSNAYIGKINNGLWLYGNKSSMYTAFTKLLALSKKVDNNMVIDVPASIKGTINTLDVSVMSYNVYWNLSIEMRDPQDVIATVNEKSPDVFGLNESGRDWINLFKTDSNIKANYACAEGKAAESGDDALYNPVFYRKDKYDLVESGTKWLSDTPDKMSKFADAEHYKIFTYVVLKDKTNGVEFMYINVHFDGSGKQSTQAALEEVRRKQADILKKFTDGYTHFPIIMGGDFNAAPSSNVIKKISTNSRFAYCLDVAKKKVCDIGGTKVVNDDDFMPTEKSGTLDYLFVTSESITVKLYEQVDNAYRDEEGNIIGCPSDHLPVYAEVAINY